MKKKVMKWAIYALAVLASGCICYEGVHSLKYWQEEKITVTGEQIAKRVTSTKYGDEFYLLMDSQYGIIEIPVTYNTYLHSSNDEIHSLRIKLLTANNALEDTHRLHQAYPFLQYFGLHIAVWAIALTLGFMSLFAFIPAAVEGGNLIYPLGWLGVNILGATLGLIL